jgi:hypothetical protein
MKNMRYITICAGILLVLACGKDKPATKPSIKIKSISGDIVPVGGNLRITLEFDDKEGDVNDSLFMGKIRLNTIPPVSGITIRDTLYIQIPNFPAKSSGEILLDLDYQNYLISASEAPPDPANPGQKISDTLILKFALQDRAGHTSDTISTEKIVIMR